jgi:hypothetical protein
MLKLEMVAPVCNPSHLGGGNREDQGLRPDWAKSLQNYISTNGWVRWLTFAIPATQGSIRPAQA